MNSRASTANLAPIAGYPMRPQATQQWSREEIAAMLPTLTGEYIAQPKLDGDRCVLVVKDDGATELWNRHGSLYHFTARNRGDYGRHLPTSSIFDGEVWGRDFHPFDCIRWGDLEVDRLPVEARIEYARRACELVGNAYLFATPTPAWVLSAGPEWEGVVLKLRGSAYRPLKKPFHESFEWYKVKW